MLDRIEFQRVEVLNMKIVEDEAGCSKISYGFQ